MAGGGRERAFHFQNCCLKTKQNGISERMKRRYDRCIKWVDGTVSFEPVIFLDSVEASKRHCEEIHTTCYIPTHPVASLLDPSLSFRCQHLR